ncbi:MAG TPA: hypothetical protein VKY85_13850 [Candidatus Angelobacter sp.]|nr:hypothetical protein [Candidatus Angelobacter sp.]
MWSNRGKFAIVVLLMLSTRLVAQSSAPATELENDQQAYCEYLSQQAQAQRDLLRTPSAATGITQPTAALPMQVFWGVTSSLSAIKKAGLTVDVAQKNCDLYAATTSAQQDIQFALPNLEKQALEHRLDLIQQASQNLDALIAGTTKMLEAQNVTRPMLFALQTTRIKLDADRADTQSKIAALYTPDLSDKPIKQLVAQKQQSEAAAQKTLDKLSRQSDWDVSLSFGARQQINPFDSRGAYGAVTVSYNLASRAINEHLDQAANAFDDWKKVQQGDVTRNSDVLRQQVTSGISVQRARLKALQDEEQELESNLQLVDNVDTTAALDFRNQLAGTQLLLAVETGDASFRLSQMQDFLAKNY